MHILLKGQILGGSEGHTGGGDTFDGRVVREVREQHRAVDSACAAEILDKEFGFLEGNSDGGENHGEVGSAVEHLCLSRDLSRQIGVGQARTGEDGQFLSADQGIQSVDGGDTRLDKFVGVVAGGGVHRQAVDITVFCRQNLGTAVDGMAHAVENTAEHIARNSQLQGMPQEANLGFSQIDAGGGLKELNNSVVAVYFKHLAAADAAVGKLDLAQLVVGDTFHLVNNH
ncbi:hypothetical protein SDC9_176935 [bioreactor metagenome]|uniref:Uncharacterized protein n=1 Tax=bioreactor metagenome TaxID=1076179 RepID=A0A645GU25_9ZZZZ